MQATVSHQSVATQFSEAQQNAQPNAAQQRAEPLETLAPDLLRDLELSDTQPSGVSKQSRGSKSSISSSHVQQIITLEQQTS